MDKVIKSLDQAARLSCNAPSNDEHDADFEIVVNGMVWNCYTVSIAERDVLCYCKEGTATFLVDTYGDRMSIELFTWDSEDK